MFIPDSDIRKILNYDVFSLYLDCITGIDINIKVVNFFVDHEINIIGLFNVFHKILVIICDRIYDLNIIKKLITNHHFIIRTLITLSTDDYPYNLQIKIR